MPFKSVADEMHKFKHGKLHSGGSGKVVTDPKQAIAISLSEQRKAGGGVLPSSPPAKTAVAPPEASGDKMDAPHVQYAKKMRPVLGVLKRRRV